MKRSYKYFLSLLFIMTAIPFLCIAQTPKKLKKADVLVRSDKEFSVSGKKVFMVAYSPSNLSEEELSYRDALLSGFLTNQGAIVVDKESDAECIAISVFKDTTWTNSWVETTSFGARYGRFIHSVYGMSSTSSNKRKI